MNAGRSRLREGRKSQLGVTERRREASRGVIRGGYRRRGVGGNGGGRGRNQTSRHRVERVDGEGSTSVRANDPCERERETRKGQRPLCSTNVPRVTTD
ncbi:hypothetical protein ALC60_09436 [Trachymyrmex zeteki]|uniref:Uncharacterized protein n=1 Tax=Mycetomoellerius zeteki TaxID=64791 RepID=A0A151WUC4_9HYME|nr:hypothetical protein ALC60_09436 [Trachymyrmex zeteki]